MFEAVYYSTLFVSFLSLVQLMSVAVLILVRWRPHANFWFSLWMASCLLCLVLQISIFALTPEPDPDMFQGTSDGTFEDGIGRLNQFGGWVGRLQAHWLKLGWLVLVPGVASIPLGVVFLQKHRENADFAS